MLKSHVPLHLCPCCGATLDAVASVGGDYTPSPDDFSVCIECGAYVKFDKDLRIVELTDEEYVDLPLDERQLLRAVRLAVQRMRQARGDT